MTLRRWDNGKKLKAKRHPMNNYRLYNRKELETILKEISKK
jgi:DNA-binding transcriptional MerR regulator